MLFEYLDLALLTKHSFLVLLDSTKGNFPDRNGPILIQQGERWYAVMECGLCSSLTRIYQ